jgi:Ca2+:H+ antiporter
VIVPLAGLGLVLPRFTVPTSDASASPVLAGFLTVASIALYAIFLAAQTLRHQHYFQQPRPAADDQDDVGHDHQHLVLHSLRYHTVMLLLTMLPLVLLSKKMA